MDNKVFAKCYRRLSRYKAKIRSELIKCKSEVYQKLKSAGIIKEKHSIEVKALIAVQKRKKSYNRLDYFVMLLAIEEENGLNDYGWGLYRKIASPKEINRFREQILCYTDNGNKLKKPLIDGFLNVGKGASSIAIAMYYGITRLECTLGNRGINVCRDRDYLIKKGFDEKEISKIEERKELFLNTINNEFLWILWPTVYNYFDDITRDIQKVCEVVKTQDVSISTDQLAKLVYDVYDLHRMPEFVLIKKGEYLKQFIGRMRLIYVKHDYLSYKCPGTSDDILLIQNDSKKCNLRKKYDDKIDSPLMGFVHNEDGFERDEQLREIIAKYCV